MFALLIRNEWTIGDWETLFHFGNGWDTVIHNEVQDLTERQPLHYHFHTQIHTDSRTRISAETSAVYCPEGSDIPTTVGPGKKAASVKRCVCSNVL